VLLTQHIAWRASGSTPLLY